MNIFEGARRITKIIAVMWVIGWGYYLITAEEPDIHPYFRVDSPGSIPIRMTGEICEQDDASKSFEYHYKFTSKGTRVDPWFCFKAKQFDDGRKLIPISVDDADQLAKWIIANKDKKGSPDFERTASAYQNAKNSQNRSVWGYDKYSTEVTNYTNEVFNAFKLSKADEEWADDQVWPARWKEIKESSYSIIGGLAFLFIFSWCIGWIVRGFAGIPSGQDKKPDDI
jgi:hypothetical protein